MTKAEIVDFANAVYETGSWGGAIAHAKFIRKLPMSETSKIKDAFRPILEEELARLKAMNKNYLNKNYPSSFVNTTIKLLDESSHEFTIDECCKRYLAGNGHKIVNVMSINDIFKRPIRSKWYPHNGDWHDCTFYDALIPNDDGTYTRILNKTIVQEPIPRENRRHRWPRKKYKDSFVKLVKEYVDAKENEGWTLTATSTKNPWGTTDSILVFEKAVVDAPVKLDTVQPNESSTIQPIYFGGIAIMPEKKDIDRISKIINECGDDHAKAISKATLMNNKITGPDKRLRRRAACVALKADWLATCFA